MTDILSDDELIDNAAACAQFRPLFSDIDETDESLRECVKLNVCKPLRCAIDDARRFAEEAAARYNALLEDRRVLRCAFCDAEYPPDTPPTQHEALTAHVKVCPKHPMREAEAERDRLRHALEMARPYLDLLHGSGDEYSTISRIVDDALDEET